MASVRFVCDSAAFRGTARRRLEGSRVAGGDAEARVSVLETDEAKGLLQAGQTTGSLTAEEITLALDELDLDTNQIEDFYGALEELHIEVVAAADAVEVEEEAEADEVSTDALQLFL